MVVDRSGMNKVIGPEYRIKSEVGNRIAGFWYIRQLIHAWIIGNIDKINFDFFLPFWFSNQTVCSCGKVSGRQRLAPVHPLLRMRNEVGKKKEKKKWNQSDWSMEEEEERHQFNPCFGDAVGLFDVPSRTRFRIWTDYKQLQWMCSWLPT